MSLHIQVPYITVNYMCLYQYRVYYVKITCQCNIYDFCIVCDLVFLCLSYVLFNKIKNPYSNDKNKCKFINPMLSNIQLLSKCSKLLQVATIVRCIYSVFFLSLLINELDNKCFPSVSFCLKNTARIDFKHNNYYDAYWLTGYMF